MPNHSPTSSRFERKPFRFYTEAEAETRDRDGRRVVKEVRIESLVLVQWDISDPYDRDYGELRAYWKQGDWDVDTDGLIYADAGWMDMFRKALVKAGFSSAAARDVGYSENGMQGERYVSMDAGKQFIREWNKWRPETAEPVDRRFVLKASADKGTQVSSRLARDTEKETDMNRLHRRPARRVADHTPAGAGALAALIDEFEDYYTQALDASGGNDDDDYLLSESSMDFVGDMTCDRWLEILDQLDVTAGDVAKLFPHDPISFAIMAYVQEQIYDAMREKNKAMRREIDEEAEAVIRHHEQVLGSRRSLRRR